MSSIFKNTASDMPVEQVRSKMKNHFGDGVSGNEANKKWDELWEQDFMPWDRSIPNPALDDAISRRKDLIPPVQPVEPGKRRPRALVPGTGRGYDVLLLASLGYDAVGLDVSEKAIAACREYERTDGDHYPARDSATGKGTVTWVCDDFFSNAWNTAGDGKFDLIYDYTFFCALHPSLRPKIAARYQELLARNGRLICLEFPSNKPPSTGGPPYAMPEKVYLGYLRRPGESLPVDDDFDLQEEKLGPVSASGLQRIGRWFAEKTHQIGAGVDHVSVWGHPDSGMSSA
jgi:SAM-dependent methyltransferase